MIIETTTLFLTTFFHENLPNLSKNYQKLQNVYTPLQCLVTNDDHNLFTNPFIDTLDIVAYGVIYKSIHKDKLCIIICFNDRIQ